MALWNALARALARARRRARLPRGGKRRILYDVELCETVRAWDNYRENMYFTEVDERPMGLKPMNCPAHMPDLQGRARTPTATCRSATAEAGLVHRNEPSGVLHGLLRVRHITQDDAHIFCTEEQVQEEVVQLPALRLRPVRAVRVRAAPGALDTAGPAASAAKRCGIAPRGRWPGRWEGRGPGL